MEKRVRAMQHVYDNFTECYLGLASDIYNNCDFICSPRGQKVKEKLGVKFTILDPRKRIPYIKARKFSMQYMIAELLWYLSGDNSTEWISNYSTFWKYISDDGKTANSAYGARIFKKNNRISDEEFIQWDYIIDELTKDPDSRRAVIHIRVPADSIHAKLDVPCTLSLQFFIRDKKLHQIVNMRSSDLILGIAYDIPAFTFLQEMLANQLNVELGTYTHISNSLHIYEKHFPMVENMLQENISDNKDLVHSMPNQPPTQLMHTFENKLRKSFSIEDINHTIEDFLPNCDDGYWVDWIKILASHRLKQLKFKSEALKMQNSTSFKGYHKHLENK